MTQSQAVLNGSSRLLTNDWNTKNVLMCLPSTGFPIINPLRPPAAELSLMTTSHQRERTEPSFLPR